MSPLVYILNTYQECDITGDDIKEYSLLTQILESSKDYLWQSTAFSKMSSRPSKNMTKCVLQLHTPW
jgi:hypothetical protein